MFKKARLACLVLICGTAQAAPSFNCAKAGTAVEKAICSDAELSQLDRRLADVYRKVASTERSAQRAWIKQRNTCKADIGCLITQYQERLLILEQLAGVSPSKPSSTLSTDVADTPIQVQTEPKPVQVTTEIVNNQASAKPPAASAKNTYLSEDYNRQIYKRLGVNGWALCTANQIALSALDSRDGLPIEISEANKTLGKVLTDVRQLMLANNHPEKELDTALQSNFANISSGDQAVQTVNDCSSTIASEIAKVNKELESTLPLANKSPNPKTPANQTANTRQNELSTVEKAGVCGGYHLAYAVMSDSFGHRNDRDHSVRVVSQLDAQYGTSPSYNSMKDFSVGELTKAIQTSNTTLITLMIEMCRQIGAPEAINTGR